jgi:hypothetical protein
VPKVKQHLEKHYAQFDLVAPWHKSADENQSAEKGRVTEKAQNMDLEKMKAELEKAQKDLLDLRVQKELASEKLKIAEDKLSLSDGKVKTLEAELVAEKTASKKLGEDLAAASARMEKAEAGVVELMVDTFVGTKITPAEKTGYVEARTRHEERGRQERHRRHRPRPREGDDRGAPELKLLKSVEANGKSPSRRTALPADRSRRRRRSERGHRESPPPTTSRRAELERSKPIRNKNNGNSSKSRSQRSNYRSRTVVVGAVSLYMPVKDGTADGQCQPTTDGVGMFGVVVGLGPLAGAVGDKVQVAYLNGSGVLQSRWAPARRRAASGRRWSRPASPTQPRRRRHRRDRDCRDLRAIRVAGDVIGLIPIRNWITA